MSTRKQEILALARTLFAERGYSATSMRDLAEASGVLPGSLYAHFRSKADLARQIVIAFFVDLLPAQQAVLDADGTGAERFGRMIDLVFDICSRHHEAVRVLHYDWKELTALDEMQEVRDATDRTLDLWRDVARAGVEDGSIQPDVDPEYMLRIATSAIIGILDLGRFQMRAAPVSDLGAADHLKRSILLGITTPSGAASVATVAPAPARPAKARRPAKAAAKKTAVKRR